MKINQVTTYQGIRSYNTYTESVLVVAYQNRLFTPGPLYNDKNMAIRDTQQELESGHTCMLIKNHNNNYVIYYKNNQVDVIEKDSSNQNKQVDLIEGDSSNQDDTLNLETIELTVVSKQYRGCNYLKYSWEYEDSINQAKNYLKQNKIVQFIIHLKGPKNIPKSFGDNLINNLAKNLQEETTLKEILEIRDRQIIIQFLPAFEKQSTHQQSEIVSNHPIKLEVIVKQYRGSSYLQKSWSYQASIHQAKKLIEQGNTVTLTVIFQSNKKPETKLVDQLFDSLVEEFQEFATVQTKSQLKDCQMLIQLTPQVARTD